MMFRNFLQQDPLDARELAKDAVSGFFGGAAAKAISTVSKVGIPAVSFFAKYGRGAALGIYGVTMGYIVGGATGETFDRKRFATELGIAAVVGLAIDYSARGISAGATSFLGREYMKRQSLPDYIAKLAKRIEQISRQLPEGDRSAYGKMLKKVEEKLALEGELEMTKFVNGIAAYAEQAAESGIVGAADDISRRIATFYTIGNPQ